MFEPEHEISSDLEWMLQSGQASAELLLEAMIGEYYRVVYRLALGLLDAPDLARQATGETFVRLTLHVHAYRSTTGVRPWIFREALASCKRMTPKPPSLAHNQALTVEGQEFDVSTQEKDGAFKQALQDLPRQPRQILLLYALCGLPTDEIAGVLKLPEKTIQDQLHSALKNLTNADQANGEIPLSPPSEYQFLDRLQAIIPAAEVSEAELAEVAAWAAEQIRARSLRRRLASHARELALVGAAIVLAALIFWGTSSRWAGENPDQASLAVGPTPAPRQAAVYLTRPGDTFESIASVTGLPVESLGEVGDLEQSGQTIDIPLDVYSDTLPVPLSDPPQVKSLSTRSDSQAIYQRLGESSSLWNTLWLQAEALDYGPAGYIGPPVGSRYQAWVSQSGQSLELVGQLSGQIDRVNLVADGRQFYSQGRTGRLYIEPWDQGNHLLQNETLRHLVFPESAPWMQAGGVFEAIEGDRAAGRRVVVVDWRNPTGEREYRLWLDVRTGVVLRLQHFGGGDGQILLSDVLVTLARVDQAFPAEIFDPRTAGLKGFTQDELGTPFRYALSPTLAPQVRTPLAYKRPPINMDISRSPLVFQFPLELEETSLVSGTQTIEADLFAGGYFLGKIPFNLPWSLVCSRSPDGQRLAYAVLPIGQSPGLFGWFNLSEPDRIYGAAEDVQVRQLVFAPDNQRLAIFGQNNQPPFTMGISILDLGTGTLENILEIAEASSLQWSPDGNYLAFLGKVDERYLESDIFVINLNTHQVIYRQSYRPEVESQPDSPMSSWGVEFPVPEDLYPCAAARQ